MTGNTRCNLCGKVIFWARTEQGKAIRVDADPVENGNIILAGEVAHYVPPGGTVPGILLYVSHSSTCPNANQHREQA